MIAAMAKDSLPRFTESAINELFTARIYFERVRIEKPSSISHVKRSCYEAFDAAAGGVCRPKYSHMVEDKVVDMQHII